MRTKSICLLVIIGSLILLTGCSSMRSSGSYFMMGSKENIGSNEWSIHYGYFNGYKQRIVSLSSDGTHVFTVQAETSSGDVGVLISNERNSAKHEVTSLKTSSFDIEVEGRGPFVIRVDGKDHVGGISIKWQ